MVVKLKPETESRLKQLATETGREPSELIEDAMAGYLTELEKLRKVLDTRYDEIKSGAIKPISGDAAFEQLHRKSESRRRR